MARMEATKNIDRILAKNMLENTIFRLKTRWEDNINIVACRYVARQ
jgi:hypothetical protein